MEILQDLLSGIPEWVSLAVVAVYIVYSFYGEQIKKNFKLPAWDKFFWKQAENDKTVLPSSDKSVGKQAENDDYGTYWKKSILIPTVLILVVLIGTFIGPIPKFSGIVISLSLASILWVVILGTIGASKNKRVGIYIAPFQMQIFRISLSLCAGQVLGFLIAVADLYANKIPSPDWVFILIGLFFTIPFWIEDDVKIKIPINHCGVITFFGKRFSWFFTEGDFNWYGKRLFFNVSQSPIIDPATDPKNSYTTAGEKKGFPNLNRRTLNIWHDITSKDTIIKLLSKTSTTVTTRLTIGIETFDPIKWMLFNDPISEISNRARASLREVVKNFIDVDVNPSEALIKELLNGEKVFVAFTLVAEGLSREGSIVRDNAGIPIYEVIKNNEGEEAEVLAKKRLLAKLKNANSAILKAATFPEGGGLAENDDLNIHLLSLKETIGEIAKSTGSDLYMIAMSGTDVSETVKKATEKLASEAHERAAEKQTANSVSDIQKILGSSGDVGLVVAANIAKVANVRALAVSSGGGKEGDDLGSKIIAAAGVIADKNEQ